MRVRESWQNSKEIIDTERGDERSQHQRLLMWRDVLATLAAVALIYVVAVELWPLPKATQLRAYATLPAVLFFAAMLALIISTRWRRPYSPEFQRASTLRTLAWWPFGAVVAGGITYVLHASWTEAFTTTVGFIVGGLLFAAVSLYRYRSSRGGGTDE